MPPPHIYYIYLA